MDNKNLTEEEITEKGNPKNPLGEYGSLMLRRMNRSHQPLTKFALGFLNFKADDVILDIGCGGGNTLKLIHEYNPKAKLYGVDHSITSVNETIKYNKELVDDKTLEVINSDVEKLPFDDNTFSKIITVESFYFWPNQKENLKEVLRVLKPHGHLLVVNDIYDYLECSNFSSMKISCRGQMDHLYKLLLFLDSENFLTHKFYHF